MPDEWFEMKRTGSMASVVGPGLTTYLSARCPVVVAPAMDLDMFAHAATQANLATLRSHGVRVVGARGGPPRRNEKAPSREALLCGGE